MAKLYVGKLPSEVTNDGLQQLFGYKAKRRKKTTPAPGSEVIGTGAQ